MDPIYVTGHRNPDTDSIVAAMAYAALRNACGDREYEAACLGRVSDETEMVLAVQDDAKDRKAQASVRKESCTPGKEK